jgi:acetyl-CoA synthetase (ADP-forming)
MSAERLDAAAALERIIRPKSVVVIGANESVGGMPSAPVRNLLRHQFTGRISVVNPRRDSVFGVPSYPSVAALPDVPDTAVLWSVRSVCRTCCVSAPRTGSAPRR